MNEPPLKVDRASWAGTRIICEQVSPESPVIFDLILELHHSCKGDWRQLLNTGTAAHSEDEQNLDRFLVYAALFLFNNGNFYGYGDRKFVPGVSSEFITSLARNASLKAQDLLERCIEPLMSTQPSLLGFPGKYSQSGYYPGSVKIMQEEVKQIDRFLTFLESRNIGMENTRIVKMQSDESPSVKFEVLQASSTVRDPELIGNLEDGSPLLLRKGDYSHHLSLISDWLSKAKDFAQNDKQREFLGAYIEYFRSGDIQHFKQAQTLWIQDTSPVVENVIGFVEQYRDPAGSRAEFEGIVALADKEATKKLSKMVESSEEFIAELPWVSYFGDEEGLGPLESARFKAPDFTAIHALAYCSSVVFLGINLPNYDDIRDQNGFKNVMIANRNRPPNLDLIDPAKQVPLVDPREAATYMLHEHYAWDIHIAIHELLGHGTGNRHLKEEDDGSYNFDKSNPPANPLTGQPIQTFYKKNQTVTSVFDDLGQTLNECRADCVALYLITNKKILSIFGYNDTSDITADELIYANYLHAIVSGLNALMSYDIGHKVWGQAHERGFFAILNVLLAEDGFFTLDIDKEADRLTVRIDRTKILSHGKVAVGKLLLQLHMWRCTADYEAAKETYEALTAVTDDWVDIRDIVGQGNAKSWAFVSGNTFIRADGNVELKEYEETPAGLIQSWADRFPLGSELLRRRWRQFSVSS